MKKQYTQRRTSVFEAITTFNAGREPERLAMKLAKMARNPFVFLRGACHMFYDALPDSPISRDAPLAWCCGDAHFENFGGYKGDNRQVYFDINDFDEAALAPFTWDIVRLLASIQCGAGELNASRQETLAANHCCLQAYVDALAKGKPLWVERETSEGLVNALLGDLRDRNRGAFLDQRSIRHGRSRALIVDGRRALPVSDAQRTAVIRFMKGFAAKRAEKKFFKVLDIGRRIAGTGSLGLTRFVILVEGKGSPNGNYLLEIKQCRPSALAPSLLRLGIKQPPWPDEARRVVGVQSRMQAVDHAFLHPIKFAGLDCVLKELQPSEDRVAIGDWDGKRARLDEVVGAMGRVLAWDQLRASGRSGAACADELIAFANRRDFVKVILSVAADMAEISRRHWTSFAEQATM
ncbi:MAG: DUF2252 domain-containing protein [Betaproteobacteria bacterium]|nr:DUF2252 domain-containing protein [Betaproteobacteria bacterium]